MKLTEFKQILRILIAPWKHWVSKKVLEREVMNILEKNLQMLEDPKEALPPILFTRMKPSRKIQEYAPMEGDIADGYRYIAKFFPFLTSIGVTELGKFFTATEGNIGGVMSILDSFYSNLPWDTAYVLFPVDVRIGETTSKDDMLLGQMFLDGIDSKVLPWKTMDGYRVLFIDRDKKLFKRGVIPTLYKGKGNTAVAKEILWTREWKDEKVKNDELFSALAEDNRFMEFSDDRLREWYVANGADLKPQQKDENTIRRNNADQNKSDR